MGRARRENGAIVDVSGETVEFPRFSKSEEWGKVDGGEDGGEGGPLGGAMAEE